MEVNKNLVRDIKSAYFKGATHDEIKSKYGIGSQQLKKIINKIVDQYPEEAKHDRIEHARVMEAHIFDLIAKGKDCTPYINHFSTYCA